MICDKCKQGNDIQTPHPYHLWMSPGLKHQDPVVKIDLCKGCVPIVKKALEDLIWAIKKG